MNYSSVYRELKEECKSAKIVAVSKTRSIDEIRQAYEAGFRVFGENHVQEIVEKFKDWHPEDVEVHMIGHLQSNKVNKVVPLVDMIQSVDSLSLLKKIDACSAGIGKVMPVLLEFNTSEEAAKSGFVSEEEVFQCISESLKLKNTVIKGFMTVGPINTDFTHKSFARLRNLSIKCKEMFPQMSFTELSMGMSGDYRIGLEEGATMVRIGTLIFGERHYV